MAKVYFIEKAAKRSDGWTLALPPYSFWTARAARQEACRLWESQGERREWFRVRNADKTRAAHVLPGGTYLRCPVDGWRKV